MVKKIQKIKSRVPQIQAEYQTLGNKKIEENNNKDINNDNRFSFT